MVGQTVFTSQYLQESRWRWWLLLCVGRVVPLLNVHALSRSIPALHTLSLSVRVSVASVTAEFVLEVASALGGGSGIVASC